MDDQTKTFDQAMGTALEKAARSQEQSTQGSTTSAERDHKIAFLQMFRRWEVLFKRKDSTVEADKWLIAEYYKSLGHLSAHGFDLLTEELKTKCIFFPTIKECLDITNPPRYSYGNPFNTIQPRGRDAIGSVEWWGAVQPKRIEG